MPYVPGDNWIICDISGRRLLMSQSVKTWDGLWVHPDYWYPKHPQLSVRSVKDSMVVKDARPRPTNTFVSSGYGFGSFTLTSPGGINYIVYIDDNGTLRTVQGTFGPAIEYMLIGEFSLRVGDDGTLYTVSMPGMSGPSPRLMQSDGGYWFHLALSPWAGQMAKYNSGVIFNTGRLYNESGVIITTPL